MLTNEQRAHDLAILIVKEAYDLKSKSSIDLNISEFEFDFYKEYVAAYNAAYVAFSRDFPDKE